MAGRPTPQGRVTQGREDQEAGPQRPLKICLPHNPFQACTPCSSWLALRGLLPPERAHSPSPRSREAGALPWPGTQQAHNQYLLNKFTSCVVSDPTCENIFCTVFGKQAKKLCLKALNSVGDREMTQTRLVWLFRSASLCCVPEPSWVTGGGGGRGRGSLPPNYIRFWCLTSSLQNHMSQRYHQLWLCRQNAASTSLAGSPGWSPNCPLLDV